ncbi:RDD family protein [Kitasatospora aureofaciens]|uniref:RDD family protein n=1 Tax=Kitasatospora aureofaciens TaxID=1894 RepID=UPI001D796FF6|nr:RDD family protein [Kitasatospora aureofaciens]HJD84268.1 RDD family protein [Kitasatospora aureofaciens]
MAQGYPPPQYPQYPQYPQNPQNPQNPQGPPNGYGPNPYGQGPYAQPPQPYPQDQRPYAQPQPYPQAQQPYGQDPYPQARPALPPCPPEAYAGRRFLAVVLDFGLAFGLGFATAIAIADDNTAKHAEPVVHAAGHAAVQSPVVPFWVAFLGAGLLASFLNQVVLARLTGFSVGKGIMAMRVVRRKRVMRPNTWRLTRRWLLGFVYLAVVLISEDFDVSEGDIVGMRSVRWKHLQEYQQAVGRLG